MWQGSIWSVEDEQVQGHTEQDQDKTSPQPQLLQHAAGNRPSLGAGLALRTPPMSQTSLRLFPQHDARSFM